MKLAVLVIALLVVANVGQSQKVLCYYKNWGTYLNPPCTYTNNHEGVVADYCTHLIYFYARIDTSGNVLPSDPWSDLTLDGGKGGYLKINSLKDGNHNLSTILNIGSLSETDTFSRIAASPELRPKFLSNLVQFLHYYGFDGALIDWHYPKTDEDQSNFVTMISGMRYRFDEEDFTLGIAVNGALVNVTKVYNPKALNQADFVSVDAFFYRDSKHYGVSHPSPLYKCEGDTYPTADQENVDYVMRFKMSGVDADKLIVPAYGEGRAYTVVDPHRNGLWDRVMENGKALPCTESGGAANYHETCDKTWKSTFYDSCKIELVTNGDQVAARDSPRSIAVKAEYAKNFGGIMLRNSMESDDFDGSCGTEQILVKTMYDIIIR